MTPPRHRGPAGKPRPGAIDLHSHSTASDGLLSPSDVVAEALARDVRVLALTDHDTVGGLDEARAAANGSLELVTGVELSCSPDGYPALEGTIHMVGLLFDERDPGLQNELVAQSEDRANRAAAMVEKLQALGYPVTLADVLRHAGTGNPGRPHVARALVEAGVVATVGDAFSDALIGDGGLAYVPRRGVTPERAVALIQAAGGVAVLAHPGVIDLSWEDLEGFVRGLRAAGLDAVEVDHPDHEPPMRDAVAGLAASLDLVPIGSSDCHGYQPLALGTETTSGDAWAELRARRTARS